eukprot:m.264518 g.264518  ORF g.264518 m.264518 type:complete len:175 (+) comp28251_c0_seq1:461-985(+)
MCWRTTATAATLGLSLGFQVITLIFILVSVFPPSWLSARAADVTAKTALLLAAAMAIVAVSVWASSHTFASDLIDRLLGGNHNLPQALVAGVGLGSPSRITALRNIQATLGYSSILLCVGTSLAVLAAVALACTRRSSLKHASINQNVRSWPTRHSVTLAVCIATSSQLRRLYP